MIRKILYLTNTDWNWAKQRPQFIAEGLSDYYEVDYFSQYGYRKKNLLAENPENEHKFRLKIGRLFSLPLSRFLIIRKINEILGVLQLAFRINHYDLIWITYPSIYWLVRPLITNKSKIVYDCMDDFAEFHNIKRCPALFTRILNGEKQLCQRSDLVFASSGYLKNKLRTRYLNINEPVVINNAISLRLLNYKCATINGLLNPEKYKGYCKLIYIGTISEWFDFDIILKSLDRFENIIYFLFGPLEIIIPSNPRIKYFGTVPHNFLPAIFDFADALIMPFKNSELIYSVDPVKLYEYISFYKISIIPGLPETQKFKDYVCLYNNFSEYVDLVDKLRNKQLMPKKSRIDHELFTRENTWEKRLDAIVTNFKLIE